MYSKHELILTFLAGATSDLTAGNTTQEPLDLPARFLQQILLLPYFTMLQRVSLDFDLLFHLPTFSEIPENNSLLVSSPYQKIAACKEWTHSDTWFLRYMTLFGSNNRKVYEDHAHTGNPG